jgi:predicted TIM-barrel fold metal-dependent hydrolase
MGHIYATEDFESLRLSPSQEEARVAGENDHVAREASRWGSRAVALCSVPVLRPYALRELERCRRHPAVRGVKVHVASSGVDLREPQHRATMGAIAAWAAAERLPMLLHLDPQRRGHDSTHVEQFVYELLSGNPTLTVVVAHAGGSGGYGSWVRQVLHAAHRADARVSRGDAPGALYFDLSAVVLERASEGVAPTSDSARALLAADVRRIGLERFVFGSDWPVFGPGETIASLQRALGLTDATAASWGERGLAVFFQ